jgi:hypothetical protein
MEFFILFAKYKASPPVKTGVFSGNRDKYPCISNIMPPITPDSIEETRESPVGLTVEGVSTSGSVLE